MPSNTTILKVASSNDEVIWNAYVAQHKESSAYHQFAWLKAVNSAYGHSLLGVIAKCSESGHVIGIFPAILMKLPLIGKHICSLPYCDVGYGIADNQRVLAEMHQFLIEQLRQVSGRKLEIRNVKHSSSSTDSFHNKKVRMLLTLPESSEALLANFRSKLRSQIKKAEKNGLTFKIGTSSDLISAFYDVYTQNMRDLGSPVHAEKWFRAIIKSYDTNSLISVVYYDKRPVGGGLIIKSGDKASIPWASTLRDFNRLAPNMLLYWSLLAHCADNGVNVFDFGRSTYEEGTYKFKKQWGAEPQLLDWQTYDIEDKLIEDLSNSESENNKAREVAESIWRKLPLKLTITIGSLIRPFISL